MRLKAAYEAAGFRLANPRSDWSALDERSGRVALTVWSDEIDKTSEPWVLDCRNHSGLHAWGGRPGNAKRARHIQHALENCDGRVELILLKAVDPAAEPRSVESARPWPQRVGVVVPGTFDPEDGTFRLELRPAEGQAKVANAARRT